MVVQVITAKVGKQRRIERHPGYAVLMQCVRRNLHDDCFTTIRHHTGEKPVHLNRTRRGQFCELGIIAIVHDNGADQSGLPSNLLEQMAGNPGCRSLAISTGNTNHAKLGCRPAKKTLQPVGQPRPDPHSPARRGKPEPLLTISP